MFLKITFHKLTDKNIDKIGRLPTCNVGLDSSVARAMARLSGDSWFKSSSSKMLGGKKVIYFSVTAAIFQREQFLKRHYIIQICCTSYQIDSFKRLS